jgi:hypothetical protein
VYQVWLKLLQAFQYILVDIVICVPSLVEIASGVPVYTSRYSHMCTKFGRNCSRCFRIIRDALWYVPKETIRNDLQIPTVKEELSRHSTQYSKRVSTRPKGLTLNLQEPPRKRRLQRHLPIDLPTRFNM